MSLILRNEIRMSEGVDIVCKPWPASHPKGLFTKRDFQIDRQHLEVTCPGGHTLPIVLGQTVRFPAPVCAGCALHEQCTTSARGRSLEIHPQEDLLQRLVVLPATAEGRARLRQRVDVKHGLAHVSQRQGNQARYHGTRKNRTICAWSVPFRIWSEHNA